MARRCSLPDHGPGALAQLVERCLCKADVRSSNLLGSTETPVSIRKSPGVTYLAVLRFELRSHASPTIGYALKSRSSPAMGRWSPACRASTAGRKDAGPATVCSPPGRSETVATPDRRSGAMRIQDRSVPGASTAPARVSGTDSRRSHRPDLVVWSSLWVKPTRRPDTFRPAARRWRHRSALDTFRGRAAAQFQADQAHVPAHRRTHQRQPAVLLRSIVVSLGALTAGSPAVWLHGAPAGEPAGCDDPLGQRFGSHWPEGSGLPPPGQESLSTVDM